MSELDGGFKDFLGGVFSSNDMGNVGRGQFFTPCHISNLMSKLYGTQLSVNDSNPDFIKLHEPCCGSGGMIIAFADSFKEDGRDFRHKLYVEAVDIDEICFKMTYLQLSLLGIAAKVVLGNSLSQEVRETLYTPMFFMNGISLGLKEFEEVKCVTGQNVVQLRLVNAGN